ncbi:hypothetical protein OVA24_18460 [Luteolibacter sp. SL250]|uniref:hypothetical protein n=1 Tax=Luteolibacter sp. SL250 TaxID=2995170 RepID=UPI0022701830|nr:hypothetical protein [Luteolibacter sp. SL250]WAC19212.1 hypothetical protein OVA24_18460 [Luteolibacter sp. SL250]
MSAILRLRAPADAPQGTCGTPGTWWLHPAVMAKPSRYQEDAGWRRFPRTAEAETGVAA